MSTVTDAAHQTCGSGSDLSQLLCSLKLSYEPSYWLIQLAALTITALVLPGLRITGILGPAVLVGALAVVNAFLWDASLFFHIPKDLSTHAILIVLWNALIFWFLVKIIPGVEIRGFVAPILAPLLITATTLVAGQYATKVDWEKLAKGVVDGVQEQRDLLRRSEDRQRRSNETAAKPRAAEAIPPVGPPKPPPAKNQSFEKF